MGKSSGAVRYVLAKNNNSLKGVIETQARSAQRAFSLIERNNGWVPDWSGKDTRTLKKLLKEGQSYNKEEKFKAIQQYAESIVYKGSKRDAAMRELEKVANRAKIHRNMSRIEAELKKRERK